MHGNPFVEDTVAGKVYDGRLIKRLLKYVKPHRKLIFLAMFFMLMVIVTIFMKILFTGIMNTKFQLNVFMSMEFMNMNKRIYLGK